MGFGLSPHDSPRIWVRNLNLSDYNRRYMMHTVSKQVGLSDPNICSTCSFSLSGMRSSSRRNRCQSGGASQPCKMHPCVSHACNHVCEAAAKRIKMPSNECCEKCNNIKEEMWYLPFEHVCTMYQQAKGDTKTHLEYLRETNGIHPDVKQEHTDEFGSASSSDLWCEARVEWAERGEQRVCWRDERSES